MPASDAREMARFDTVWLVRIALTLEVEGSGVPAAYTTEYPGRNDFGHHHVADDDGAGGRYEHRLGRSERTGVPRVEQTSGRHRHEQTRLRTMLRWHR